MNATQDDAVMAGASGTQAVAAADGRTLTIAECGDEEGGHFSGPNLVMERLAWLVLTLFTKRHSR